MDGSQQLGTIRVWDAFVRLFHWSLVAAVMVAGATGFLIGGRAIDIHIWAGTAAVALVSARLIWGFLGTGFARFSDFVKGPSETLAHIRHSQRHLGHNPLGGWMVVALIAAIFGLGATGAFVLGGVFHVGPAKALATVAQGFAIREAHEVLAILLLVLIAAHVGGVVFESRRSRENLARAMVTGRKTARAGDPPVPKARAHPLSAAIIGAFGMTAFAFVALPMTRAAVPGGPVVLTNSAYGAQCVDCHIAYHPSLLPAASWEALMATLDDHFGEDASLPPAMVAELTAFLTAHAAEVTDTKPATLFRRVEAGEPFEITATPAWERIHDELPEALFEGAPVRSEGNCAACHGDAETGWFYPGKIDLPGASATPTQTVDD